MTPSISELELKYVSDSVLNGWGAHRNDYLETLTDRAAQLTGNRFCLPVSHGTAAIQLSLEALGVGVGDEVIVPDLTWVASASPVLQLGARVVFADVDETMCLSPASVAKAISSRTKAIIAVDLMGSAPKWDDLQAVAAAAGIPIVEDATESFGGSWIGRPIGSFGVTSALSFNATKIAMSGQGGAVCTNSEELFLETRLRSHHGIDTLSTGRYYWSTRLGHNFQLSNLQAALAVAQIERLDELIRYKRNLREIYREHLHGMPVTIVDYPDQLESNCWINVVVLDPHLGIKKEAAVSFFQENGVDMRPFFYRLSDMPPFAQQKVAYDRRDGLGTKLSLFGLCLPYGYDLDEEQVALVADTFDRLLRRM